MQNPIVYDYSKKLSQIHSLLRVVVLLLITLLLGMGFLLYKVIDNAEEKVSNSKQQTEEFVNGMDSLQQQNGIVDNE